MRVTPAPPRFGGLFSQITPVTALDSNGLLPGEAPREHPTDILAIGNRSTTPESFGVNAPVTITVDRENASINVLSHGTLFEAALEAIVDLQVARALAARGATAHYEGPLTDWATKQKNPSPEAQAALAAMTPRSS